jgi:hypothetical protein
MTTPKPDLDFKRELMLQPFVIIESPYFSTDYDEHEYYHTYFEAALHHSMLNGEAPFGSHGFYPEYLNDNNEYDRKLGIKLGQVIMARASFVAVYCDLGISSGMKEGIKCAHKLGLVVHRRKLGAPWKPWRTEK